MPISEIAAQASKMSVAERPICDRNPAPSEPARMPPNINVLPSAITAPRRSAGVRHWMRALIGTLMKPLANGRRAGGTCWAGSNALYELLIATGFAARRGAGSMRDMGFINHKQRIIRKVVEQRRGRLSGRTSRKIPGIVFNP